MGWGWSGGGGGGGGFKHLEEDKGEGNRVGYLQSDDAATWGQSKMLGLAGQIDRQGIHADLCGVSFAERVGEAGCDLAAGVL